MFVVPLGQKAGPGQQAQGSIKFIERLGGACQQRQALLAGLALGLTSLATFGNQGGGEFGLGATTEVDAAHTRPPTLGAIVVL
jgi:hypothetical protein